MAKKEFDISNTEELRTLRAKWQRKDEKGRTIKPYFFGHVDKTKGYYNDKRKNYLKHDTSMDYLKQIIEQHKEPRYEGEPIPLTKILINGYKRESEYRAQIKQILYQISQFQTTSFYIWNGYAETEERYKLHVEAEEKIIDSINEMTINIHTLYALLCRLENNDMSDFMIKVLFNIGNESALTLIKKSQKGIDIIEEDDTGDIIIYSKKFKKIQKTPISFAKSLI